MRSNPDTLCDLRSQYTGHRNSEIGVLARDKEPVGNGSYAREFYTTVKTAYTG